MNFRKFLPFLNAKLQGTSKAKKYGFIAVLVMVVLAIIGGLVNSRLTAEFEELKAQNKENSTLSRIYQAELLDDISHLGRLVDNTDREIAKVRGEEAVAQVTIQGLEEELEAEQVERGTLETLLNAAHENLAGAELKNSFLGERITEELYNYFPEANHLFFSETQENLFRANPATANAIYTIITENAVRIQIIGSLTDQVTITTDLLEQSDTLVTLRGEEILAYEVLVGEYDDVFDNLEAALSLERSITTNLNRQITILTRKNFFQRILPTLNIVVGPYYDPFRNQGGFAVALGLGWRF